MSLKNFFHKSLFESRRSALRLDLTRDAAALYKLLPTEETRELVRASVRAEWGEHTQAMFLDSGIEVEAFDGRKATL